MNSQGILIHVLGMNPVLIPDLFHKSIGTGFLRPKKSIGVFPPRCMRITLELNKFSKSF